MDVSCEVAALSLLLAGISSTTLALSRISSVHADKKGNGGHEGSSMGPKANDGLIVNVSSEGGDGEGAGGGGGVGFTGNLWKDVSGGDAMGTKRFAEAKMEGGVGVGLEGDGGEGGDADGTVGTMDKARGIDGVSLGGAEGGGGEGDDTAAGGRLHGNHGEVQLAGGEGGEIQLEVAGDGAGVGGSAMGDGGGTAVKGDGEYTVGGNGGKAVRGDGRDALGGDGEDAERNGLAKSVRVEGAVGRGKGAATDGAGVADVKDGCEEEDGESGDSAVGDEGKVRGGVKARRGAGVEQDVGETAEDEAVGGGDEERIRSGDGAMDWGPSHGLVGTPWIIALALAAEKIVNPPALYHQDLSDKFLEGFHTCTDR